MEEWGLVREEASGGGGPLQAPRGPNGELWRRDGPRQRSWVGARVDRHGNEGVLPWARPFSSAKVIPQKADSWGLLSANTVSTWREKSFIPEGGSRQKGTVSTRVGLNSRWDSFVSRLGGHVHPSFSISSLSNVSPWMLKKSQGLEPFPVQETPSNVCVGIKWDTRLGIWLIDLIEEEEGEREEERMRIFSWLVCCTTETSGVWITSVWANGMYSHAHG